MVITELLLQNVLKIKAVSIVPGSRVVKIAGKNAAGKSSILDGIEFILRGPSSFPEKPVREGSKQGAGQIDFGDVVVKRLLDPHKLVVSYKGSDKKIERPQQFLDSLLNRYTCDPLKLMSLSASEKLDEVKKVLGIDFTDLDKEYDDLYESRKDTKKEVRILESLTKEYDSTAATDLIDDELLEAEYKAAQKVNRRNQELRFKLTTERARVDEMCGREKELEEQLAKLRGEINEITEVGKLLAQEVDSLQDIDEDALYSEVQAAKASNGAAKENAKMSEFAKELSENKDRLERINNRIEEIKTHKIDVLANAKFPVAGLSIEGNALFYNGLPLDQASQAEKIKVCLALSVAGEPEIKVVLVRQASLLDSDSMEIIAREAEEKNLQVWLEIVGEDDELSFVIEDGSVKSSPDGDAAGQTKLF